MDCTSRPEDGSSSPYRMRTSAAVLGSLTDIGNKPTCANNAPANYAIFVGTAKFPFNSYCVGQLAVRAAPWPGLFYHKNERKLKDCCTGAVNAQSDFQINLVVVSQAIEFVARSSSMLGYAQRPTHVPIS